jgi:REP element-mobilizing transposase RayT
MARRARIEVEGGLYHVIARGNGRQAIFYDDEDHRKFLSILGAQKALRPFYLYAYCLMTNHFHLLIERRADSIGQIMHRVLTGYTQYFNRRHGRVGHVMQGRHKAILCQAETYMGQLAKYIHRNPLEAGMVVACEDYPYSSHRAYLDLEPAGIVDVDPVLRLFGVKRAEAANRFAQYVEGERDYDEKFSLADGGRMLGSDEFVDAMIHRLGDTGKPYKPTDGHLGRTPPTDFDEEALIAAIEQVFDLPREYFMGASRRHRNAVLIKEALLISGCRIGANLATLSKLVGLSSSTTSRRRESAERRIETDDRFRKLVICAVEQYVTNKCN